MPWPTGWRVHGHGCVWWQVVGSFAASPNHGSFWHGWLAWLLVSCVGMFWFYLILHFLLCDLKMHKGKCGQEGQVQVLFNKVKLQPVMEWKPWSMGTWLFDFPSWLQLWLAWLWLYKEGRYSLDQRSLMEKPIACDRVSGWLNNAGSLVLFSLHISACQWFEKEKMG